MTAPQPTVEPSQVATPPRRILIAVGTLTGVWMLGLALLTLFTANPVTLNHDQILRSDFVVTAVREHENSPELLVSREWKGAKKLGTIIVTNLAETHFPAGEPYLVPLQQIERGRFAVTATALPNDAPLVYPATPEAILQLEQVLKTP